MKNLDSVRCGVRYAAVPLTLAALAGCSEGRTRRPNIIVMMTDDHTTQAMSCYGSLLVETPNLDRLAREGMLFENCYVSNAISGPSRACILTGKYSHANGFTDNSRTFDGDQQTFPKLLHDAGYQTAMIGKWHLNSDPQGFDFWSILVGQGEYYSPLFVENGEERTEPGYVTDIITDKAIGFLERRDKSRPFAMLYYHKAPHRNWMPAQRHLGINDDRVFPEPFNLLDDYSGRGSAAREQAMEIGRDMWPEWDLKLMTPEQLAQSYELESSGDANKDDVSRANDWRSSVMQYQAAYNRMTPEERANWDRAYAPRIAEYERMKGRVSQEELTRWKYQQYMKDYCAVIKGVDENVGRLLDYLEEIGELDNTIIVYTSDQGFFLGEHGWFDKRFMYEECQRTPLLVRYPKAVAAGAGHEHRPGPDVRGHGRAGGPRRHAGPFAEGGAHLGRQDPRSVAHGRLLPLLRIPLVALREAPLRRPDRRLQAHPFLQRRGRVGVVRPEKGPARDVQRLQRSRIRRGAQRHACAPRKAPAGVRRHGPLRTGVRIFPRRGPTLKTT